jgi:hypothetical protein
MTVLDPALLGANSLECFLTPQGLPAVTIVRGRKRDTHLLGSQRLNRLLRAGIVRAGTPPSLRLSDVANSLEAAAFVGPTQPTEVRVAQRQDVIYVDLSGADGDGEVIEIDASGYRVSHRHPVHFIRPSGQRALPLPRDGGAFHDFGTLANLPAESHRLVRAWLAASLRPNVPVPPLIVEGPQGSGKSTTTRLLRAVVDPHDVPLRSPPGSERDLVVAATHSHVVALDNCSAISPQLSDALCRLITGGGFSTRRLHTDSDELAVAMKRPVLINGISNLVSRHDLADRSIFLRLAPLVGAQRREERLLEREFAELHPLLLGVVLGDVARGLRRLDEASASRCSLPRMADFAVFAMAAMSEGEALSSDVLDDYERNRRESEIEAAAGDEVLQAFLTWTLGLSQQWRGTPTELYVAFMASVPPGLRQGMPKAARSLTARLRRAETHIRDAGVVVDLQASDGRGGNKRRLIIITPPNSDDVDDGDDGDDGIEFEDCAFEDGDVW